MQRGFKSQCERRAAELRRSLDLRSDDPLSATSVATSLGVRVLRDVDVEGVSAEDLHQLHVEDKETWLALTIRVKTRFLVVYNSSHSTGRTNSMVMHELAHIMLGHELSSTQVTEDGYLVPISYDQEQEDEANWLAATLLLPRPALLRIRRERLPDTAAQTMFQVTPEMLTWRFRMTGVDFQFAR
jgi:Zn-dependent peptidase ImmA (M78 family)